MKRKKMNETKITEITVAALFTSAIAVISQVCVILPSGIPITLQTFAVALCGYVLGAKLSLTAVVTYILIGAVGLPVFSGFRGGVQHITGATGGFIVGFILLALLCGVANIFKSSILRFFCGLLGLVLCHIVGVVQFCVISGVGFFEGLVSASVPFIVKDILLLFFAQLLSKRFKSIVFKDRK